MYYICIITSVDYYTMYEGFEIVKSNSPDMVEEKAKKQFIKNNGYLGKEQYAGFEKPNQYRFIETIIFCGDKKPKVK